MGMLPSKVCPLPPLLFTKTPGTLAVSLCWFSCHSQLISELTSSRKSAEPRDCCEFPLVLIPLLVRCKHLTRSLIKGPRSSSKIGERFVSSNLNLEGQSSSGWGLGAAEQMRQILKCNWASLPAVGMAIACIL